MNEMAVFMGDGARATVKEKKNKIKSTSTKTYNVSIHMKGHYTGFG